MLTLCIRLIKLHVESWVAGNGVIVKNVNANIPVSLSWLFLPFMFAFTFLTITSFPVTYG